MIPPFSMVKLWFTDVIYTHNNIYIYTYLYMYIVHISSILYLYAYMHVHRYRGIEKSIHPYRSIHISIIFHTIEYPQQLASRLGGDGTYCAWGPQIALPCRMGRSRNPVAEACFEPYPHGIVHAISLT